MQRKFRLQPPLSFEQSRTGPNESSRTSRLSKDEEIMSSSLCKDHKSERNTSGRRNTDEPQAPHTGKSSECNREMTTSWQTWLTKKQHETHGEVPLKFRWSTPCSIIAKYREIKSNNKIKKCNQIRAAQPQEKRINPICQVNLICPFYTHNGFALNNEPPSSP